MGFKGGEFVPSVFVGSGIANSISQWMGLENLDLVAVGYVTLFGAMTNLPMTAFAVGLCLFGFSFAPFLIL